MARLARSAKAARTVSAKVPKSQRSQAIKNATSRVSAKASINFRKSVRD